MNADLQTGQILRSIDLLVGGDVTEAVLEEGDNEHTLILQLAGEVSAQLTVEVLINVINVIEQEGQAHIAPLGSVLGQNVIGRNSHVQSAQRNRVQNLFLRAQSVCGEDVDDVLARRTSPRPAQQTSCSSGHRGRPQQRDGSA